ncbi:hypothetical protein Tco_1342769, partial [Tanacetum coccineum]
DEKISHVMSKDFMAFVLDKDRVGLLRFMSAIIRPSRGLGIVVVVFNSVCGSGALGEPERKGEGQFSNMRLLQKFSWVNLMLLAGEYSYRTDYTMGVQSSTWQTGFNSITALVDMIFRWSNDGDGVLERLAPAVANLAADEKCSMEVVTFNRHLCFVNACLKLQARGSQRTGLCRWTSGVVVLYQKKKM